MIINKPLPKVNFNQKKSIKLLVVGDDDESAVQNYFSHLKDYTEISMHTYDINCKVVAKGEEALEQITQWEPSVILVDAHIGDVNSCDILEFCKKEHLPVVLTSDYHLPEIQLRIDDLGISAYLQKADSPDDFEFLLKKIADIAEESRIKH